MEDRAAETNYRWFILILAALTNTLVVAVQSMCMPVLFKEISTDLSLNLVQVGIIWGVNALPGIGTVLVGGALGDRFGPKRVLILGCLLAGLAGALRGLSLNFASLAATMFLFGLVTPFIGMNVIKTCGQWFPRRQLGLANGVLSMGMALGFLSGSLFSATLLSPALGGWRNVLFLYGGLAALFGLPWALARTAPAARAAGPAAASSSLRRNLVYVARIPNVWLLGLTILGFSGCVQGALGYLPLYLRGQGWAGAYADGASAAFHTISLLGVIPIALISDRLRTRKKVLVACGLMMLAGIGLLSVAGGVVVWMAVLLAGMVRDGFMGVFLTAIHETEGIGSDYAGTATGMVMLCSGVGNLLAPPLGNSLAALSPGLPFFFWAALVAVGFIGLLSFRERPAASPIPAIISSSSSTS